MKINQKIYWYLFPFAIIYWFIIIIRNKLFDLDIIAQKEFNIPIISVGNITVGGTGKTPHIEFLANLLKENFSIATLSRGYKRKTKRFILATINSTSFEIGDEPKQIKQKFPEIIVAVDKNRIRGIDILLTDNPGIDAILLDDAYQYRYIKPGISILLIDYNRIITKDYLLPVGLLREPAYEKRRANFIIITKCPENMKPIERRIIQKEINPFPYQNLYFTKIKYGDLCPVFSKTSQEVLFEKFKKIKPEILFISGIANPRLLKKFIRGISPKIKKLHFPDHHFFNIKDIEKIQTEFNELNGPNKIIITTEKDSIRLKDSDFIPEEIKTNLFYIPITIEFLFDQEEEFNKQIYDYVNKNKKYRHISSSDDNHLLKYQDR